MDKQELKTEIQNINAKLANIEHEKNFVVDVYKSNDCSKLISISEDGDMIKSTGVNPFTIESECLKEKIFAQLYFQEKQDLEVKFAERVNNFFSNNMTDFKFSKNLKSSLERKKVFSAMKLIARNQGYAVLNSLEECENGDNIQINVIESRRGEKVDFQRLKTVYQKLDTSYDEKGELQVINRKNGKVVEDIELNKMGKFAGIWVGAAGTGIRILANDELPGITYGFNDGSERTFYKLGNLIEKDMKEKGNINTEEIYKSISESDMYKHSGEITRNVFSTDSNMKILYDFYRMQNKDIKLETKKAKTFNENFYGYSAEDMMVEKNYEKIMKLIPKEQSKIVLDGSNYEKTSLTFQKIGKGTVGEYTSNPKRAIQTIEDLNNAMKVTKGKKPENIYGEN